MLARVLPEVFAPMDPIAFAGALGAAKPDAAAYLRAAGLTVRAEQSAGAEQPAAVLTAAGLLRR